MIYTVGNTESYLKGLSEGALEKKGRDGNFRGGSVWLTQNEAQQHAPTDSGLMVFGVIANWKADTVPSMDGDWHDLLVDAILVDIRKVKNEE